MKNIAKLKELLISDFAKVSIWSGIATVLRMAINLGISKVLAVFVGPSGFALIGQLQNGLTIFRTASSGAIGTGVTKYVSEFNENIEVKSKYIYAALKFTLLCTFVTSLVTLFFSKFIASYLFGSTDYQSIILYFALGLSLFSLNGLMLAIINGEKRFKIFITSSIVGTLFTFLITFLLVYYLGLYGALLAFAISQSLVFFVTSIMIRSSLQIWFRKFWKVKIESFYYSNLFAFSLMAITSAIVIPLSQIIIRKYIINNLSINEAGIWEGMNKVSITYLGIITMSLSTYYLPRLSEIKDNLVLKTELFKTVSLVLPISILCGLAIYLLRDLVIQILFTKEFLPMRSLFAIQMVGDSIKMLSWLFSYIMLAKAMTKTFIITEIIFAITSVILSILFIQQYGLIGTTYAYAFNYFLYLIALIIVINRHFFK